MTQCTICSKESGLFSYSCKFCSGHFCDEHRLPESHSCSGLAQWKGENEKKPEEWIYKATKDEPKAEAKKTPYIIIVAAVIMILIMAAIFFLLRQRF
jgi:hypothetical protein